MAQAPQVALVGMSALRRDAKRLTADAGPLNDGLKDAGRQAVQPVAAAVRSSVPRDSGNLSGTVRVTGSRTGAAVRMGRASVPYAGPVDFGGWPEGRDYQSGGRYLFPAAVSLAAAAADAYATGAQRAIDAFAWTNETNNAEAIHD
jgi:hypothetical protein